MSSFEFNVSPEYKKSFVDYTTIEKKIDDKKIKVTREILWRFGEIQVTVTEDEFEKYVKDKDLEINKMENNEKEFFASLQKNGVLTFDDSFPFEYEFLSSFDGCGDDYNICYDDGSDVEDSVEEEINKIIEEGDFYDLEDYHNYTVVETKYEMHGDLDIYNINF